MSNPTFFQVARRPKWIAGLALALVIAYVFVLLGQWQLERTFTTTEPITDQEQVLVLTDFAQPAMPLQAAAANKLVTANIQLDTSNVYIVANRLQQTNDEVVNGYWLISNSAALLPDETTASLSVAIGFAADLVAAEKARTELQNAMLAQAFLPIQGRYLQTEAPLARPDAAKDYLLGSFSLAELVNLYSSEPIRSFAGFVALAAEPGYGLEKIAPPPIEPGVSINWLTLFYAVEWVLFGGFAVFLWWRLVEDQVLRESTISKA